MPRVVPAQSPPEGPHDGQPASARAAWPKIALRVGTSAALLGLILAWLPLDALGGAVARVGAWVWVGVIAGFLAGHVISALKWRLLLSAAGAVVPVVQALRAHGLGLFANLCLPSLVGGDLIRAAYVAVGHGRAESVAVASIGDRVNDTLALVLLAGAGALASGGLAEGPLLRLLLAFAIAVPLGVVTAILLLLWLPLERLPAPLAPLARVGLRLREAQASVLARPARAGAALVLSLLIQAGFVWLNVGLARAMGIDLPLSVWLMAWPLAKLVALVPVSLGGLGVRELALAALLAPFGVEAATAVAQSLGWQGVLIGSGMAAGAAAWLSGASLPGALGAAASREESV